MTGLHGTGPIEFVVSVTIQGTRRDESERTWPMITTLTSLRGVNLDHEYTSFSAQLACQQLQSH